MPSPPRPVMPEPLPRKNIVPPPSISWRPCAAEPTWSFTSGKDVGVERAFHDAPDGPPVIPGEMLAISGDDGRAVWVPALVPGHEQVRRELRLAVSGRHVDDEAGDLARFDFFERRAQDAMMLGVTIVRLRHVVGRIRGRREVAGEVNQALAGFQDGFLAFEKRPQLDRRSRSSAVVSCVCWMVRAFEAPTRVAASPRFAPSRSHSLRPFRQKVRAEHVDGVADRPFRARLVGDDHVLGVESRDDLAFARAVGFAADRHVGVA